MTQHWLTKVYKLILCENVFFSAISCRMKNRQKDPGNVVLIHSVPH